MPNSHTPTAQDLPTLVEALDWLARNPARRAEVLAAVVRLGASDPLRVAEVFTDDVRGGREVVALAAAHDGPWPAHCADFMFETVGAVGAAVWLEEPESAQEWASVAGRARDLQDDAATSPRWSLTNRYAWRDLSCPRIVAEFRTQHRSPSYANAMLDAAHASQLAPNTFGYGPQMTPALLTSLAQAGVRSGQQLGAYQQAGADPAQALALAAAGVDESVAAYAAASGLPRDRWDSVLPGLPGSWFTITDGTATCPLMEAGFTWEDLRTLAGAGWTRLRAFDLKSGISFKKGRRCQTRPTDKDTVLVACRVATYPELCAWLGALTSGKSTDEGIHGSTLPALAPDAFLVEVAVGHITALKEAGLRPTHLDAYRAAGCRSVADVLTAARAGITPARVKTLNAQHGTRRQEWRPLRIANLDALLAAHAGHDA